MSPRSEMFGRCYTRSALLADFVLSASRVAFIYCPLHCHRLSIVELGHVLGARSTYERGGWFDCLRIDPQHLIIERDRTTHNALRAQMAAGVSLTGNFC